MQLGSHPLQALIAANSDLLVFADGLTFFTMGVAVALQSRRSSQLEVGRRLAWLAAFGIIHGITEWGWPVGFSRRAE